MTQDDILPPSKIGVLLVNLGTPDAAEPKAVRRYLAQFLSDRRVVELPPLLWQPILRGIILTTRPKKSAHAYSQVWTEDGSPLAAITRAQAKALAERLAKDGVIVDYAMRYGRPAIADRIAAMKAAGCDRILVAPLYPQYCAATTATANDDAFAALVAMRWQPALRTLPPYFDDPAYIDALAAGVREGLAALSFQPEVLVASFHGMPARTLALGDPYYHHCHTTGRLLAEALDLPVKLTFQSRFGKAKWFDPATDTTLEELARAGTRRVAIVAPGFSADCIETLEELALRGRDSFVEAGGQDFAYLPCLNASPRGIDLLELLARRELSGWLPPANTL